MTDPNPNPISRLRSYLARTRAVVESAPPASATETRTLLVDPFLETLGWDLHADAQRDVALDGTVLEYVCAVASTPALLVATESRPKPLARERAAALRRTMQRTGVDRAIYTNGREFLFLAGTRDVETRSCDRSALADHADVLAHYSRATAERRLAKHSRSLAARRLAVSRPALAESIATDLAAVAGTAYEAELEAAADRFLEEVVASFADSTREPPANGFEIDGVDALDGSAARDGTDDPRAGDDSRDDRAESHAEEATDGAPDPPVDSEPTTGGATSDDNGEYVVSFFADRGSIGAIGHDTPQQALVHATEFCFDRGLSGVDLPWTPDDGDRVVLARTPGDGSSMVAPVELSTGVTLETDGSLEELGVRVERIATRAGLRAMLTGDWSNVG